MTIKYEDVVKIHGVEILDNGNVIADLSSRGMFSIIKTRNKYKMTSKLWNKINKNKVLIIIQSYQSGDEYLIEEMGYRF